MKTHLKGLDTLRAIAALIVVWSHLEIIRKTYHIGVSPTYYPNAHFSVTLFFVLSGFLITYLLVKEKSVKGEISFKKFYLRRIFRIWPVYYAVLFLSYFLVSRDVSLRTIFMCLSIFPNIPMALRSSWSGSPQIWSIGVEEQFYLFWPLIVSAFPKRYLKIAIIVFIVLYTALPFLVNFLNTQFFQNEKLFSFTQVFFAYTKFNCMAIGGLLGVLFAERSRILKVFFAGRIGAVIFTAAPLLIWMFNVGFGLFTDEIYALLFAMLVIAVVANPFFNIDNRFSRFIGRISYGIYMYHWIVIVLFFKLLSKTEISSPFIVYPGIFGITILVSYVSYITFERYFLTIKKRFEV